MGHCCKTDERFRLLLPASQCPGQEQALLGSAEEANQLSCLARGLGKSPCMCPMGDPALQRYTVPLVTPGLFNFREESRNAPGYPVHQKGCANNCPSQCSIHWASSLGKKKLSRGWTNKLSTEISDAWRPLQCLFAIPFREECEEQQSVAVKAKFT